MRVGMFAGTFDPVTLGHLDILKRALHLFDAVEVAVADRHHKQTLFSADERVLMFQESLPRAMTRRVSVAPFRGLLVDHARRRGVAGIVRGLRFISDFDYEFQMALMNQRLAPRLPTLFLMPSERYTYLNSSLVKEIVRSGGKVQGLVPSGVAERLERALAAVRTSNGVTTPPRRPPAAKARASKGRT